MSTPGDSITLDTRPKEVPIRCMGAGTGPAVHREDCGTCQCDYWAHQEKIIANLMDELACVRADMMSMDAKLSEAQDCLEIMVKGLDTKVTNAWTVLASMQKRVVGGARA